MTKELGGGSFAPGLSRNLITFISVVCVAVAAMKTWMKKLSPMFSTRLYENLLRSASAHVYAGELECGSCDLPVCCALITRTRPLPYELRGIVWAE